MLAPAMSTNSMSATARMMLPYESRFTPFSMPASTEASPTAVMTAMIAAWIQPAMGIPYT